MRFLTLLTGCCLLFLSCSTEPPADPARSATGNVLFIHPDGASMVAWQAYRVYAVGPDGQTAWDQLPHLGVYRAHVRNSLAPTSHAGGTIHGYGIKVGRDSYGLDEGNPITSASGKPVSLMSEAIDRGIRCGIVQSGHLAEPGTAAMLAKVEQRSNRTEIVRQLIASGAEVILGAGEVLFLPPSETGRHGQPGVREDGLNLIHEAESAGYHVVYTRKELEALPDSPGKVLGLFAAENTYHARPEEQLKKQGLSPYVEEAPSVAIMTRHALRFLSHNDTQFFLMVEEEGTDNFGNANNASGLFEAYERADACIDVGRQFVARNPDTLLLTAADSDASGMQLIAMEAGLKPFLKEDGTLPETSDTGAALDGVEGTGTLPFTSAPDARGQTFQFAIAWPTRTDLPGGVLARAEGFKADQLPVDVDNTQLFHLMHSVLFSSP